MLSMMMKRFFKPEKPLPSFTIFAGLLMAAPAALAQPGFGPPGIGDCDDYVARAVSQIQMATDCRFTGPRWTENSTEHKNWCARSTPIARGFENGARQDALVQCRGNKGAVPIATCKEYVSRAASQIDLAGRLKQAGENCTFSGPRWSSNSGEHMNWCNRSTPELRRFEDGERRKAIAACRLRPSGSPPVVK